MKTRPMTRRAVLAAGASSLAAMALPAGAATPGPATRKIPSSGETIPAVGLGSWITFNVGNDPVLRDECAAVIGSFFAAGGRLIDSSPMYGSAQAVIGYGLKKIGAPKDLFAADKVWTSSASGGPADIRASIKNWSLPKFDLLQVHNLVGWQSHLPLLRDMKAAGAVRYIGITTSHGRRHDEVESIMRREPIDFVQLTYNTVDREAENRLLPLASDRGIAVIVNRPFRRGQLTRGFAPNPLPDWAEEIKAATWAQFHLKFVLSHPSVTVAIPATTIPGHAAENVAASAGPLPDHALRDRMAAYVQNL